MGVKNPATTFISFIFGKFYGCSENAGSGIQRKKQRRIDRDVSR